MARLKARPMQLLLMIILVFSGCAGDDQSTNNTEILSRATFPKGFTFGAASASYQYEGAVSEGGRGPSTWDVFAHIPGTIADGTTGDVAVDQYHRYKEDVDLLKFLGVDAYRFSISWSRIFPEGRGRINHEGVNYYNRLIDELVKKGVQPYVTIFHWDTPQALDVAYKSWLSSDVVHDYAVFSETCFKLFGDRVKYWITFNEPHIFINFGYNLGTLAPGRCSAEIGNGNCTTKGNSSLEPYTAGHNLLLSHSAAVNIYRTKYQAKQHGYIGITLDSKWHEPFTNSTSDVAAAKRGLDFNLGWFLDPVIFGDYPATMRSRVGDRLPKFTKGQSEMIKGSSDFVGINHYTSIYDGDLLTSNEIPSPPVPDISQQAYFKDTGIKSTASRDGKLIGRKVNAFYIVPEGFKKLLDYIRIKYNNPIVIITENGLGDVTNSSSPLKEVLNDDIRINFFISYLTSLYEAIRDGSDVRGYFVWSFLDNFEWANGLSFKFGLYHVDYNDNLKRIPKKSAFWYKGFLDRKYR